MDWTDIDAAQAAADATDAERAAERERRRLRRAFTGSPEPETVLSEPAMRVRVRPPEPDLPQREPPEPEAWRGRWSGEPWPDEPKVLEPMTDEEAMTLLRRLARAMRGR